MSRLAKRRRRHERLKAVLAVLVGLLVCSVVV